MVRFSAVQNAGLRETPSAAAAPEAEVRELDGTRDEEMTFKKVWAFLRMLGWRHAKGDKLHDFFYVSRELYDKRKQLRRKPSYAKLGVEGKDFFSSERAGIDLVRQDSVLFNQYRSWLG